MRTDQRHVLNLSGALDLPRRFQVSFSVSFYSRPPFSPYVSGVDFNGDGTLNDLLPGVRVNQINRGLDKADLASLVERYNQQFANTRTVGGQTAPPLVLPSNLEFNDAFFTQDLRVSRTSYSAASGCADHVRRSSMCSTRPTWFSTTATSRTWRIRPASARFTGVRLWRPGAFQLGMSEF
jgi:hypothetical protein